MPTNPTTQQHKDYFLLYLNAEAWEVPCDLEIEDEDLTFDGKPLNMLYEENRFQAELHVFLSRERYSSHNQASSHGKEKSHMSRGRSRQK